MRNIPVLHQDDDDDADPDTAVTKAGDAPRADDAGPAGPVTVVVRSNTKPKAEPLPPLQRALRQKG